jgi:pilus assembly protein CpaF
VNVLLGAPLGPLFADGRVTEIVVNGPDEIFAEISGRLERVDGRFRDAADLRHAITGSSGCAAADRRRHALVDTRLPDGSRVNAVLPPLAVDGPLLTVRRFGGRPLRMADLVSLGTVSAEDAALLARVVTARLNVLVSGGTSSGKTTTLGALSAFFDPAERVVTVEDAAELSLVAPHVVRLESRPPSVEGRGAVDIRALVRNALRMRPDRIVVGEVRGGEALDMLQAMNTGHDGSLATVHANTPRDALRRLETMALMGGLELPHAAVREQVGSAVHVVVQQERTRDGRRTALGHRRRAADGPQAGRSTTGRRPAPDRRAIRWLSIRRYRLSARLRRPRPARGRDRRRRDELAASCRTRRARWHGRSRPGCRSTWRPSARPTRWANPPPACSGERRPTCGAARARWRRSRR